MNALIEYLYHLPDGDGYFGYRIFKEYIEYVDIDNWAGNGDTKYWSHQEFYKAFKNSQGGLEQATIKFLIDQRLIELRE